MEIIWFITIGAALIITCDLKKVFGILNLKYLPIYSIISLGLTAPHSLSLVGIPVWLSALPCYVAMMLALVMYPKRKTLE
jgi:hypothetical protein